MPFENVKYFLENYLTDIVGLFLVCSVDFNVPLNKGKKVANNQRYKILLESADVHWVVYQGLKGTPDFKWQGWSKDFFGFEIFNFGIFSGRKILASYFLGSLI